MTKCAQCNATRHTTEECRERRLMDHERRQVDTIRRIANIMGLDLREVSKWGPNNAND